MQTNTKLGATTALNIGTGSGGNYVVVSGACILNAIYVGGGSGVDIFDIDNTSSLSVANVHYVGSVNVGWTTLDWPMANGITLSIGGTDHCSVVYT